LCNFLHSPVTSSLLGPNILLRTLFSNTLSLCSSLSVRDRFSHPYKTTGRIMVLYILTFTFLDCRLHVLINFFSHGPICKNSANYSSELVVQPKQLVLCWKPDLSSTVIASCEDKLTRNLLKEYCYINMLITPLYF
jgi:hypothetical protein